MKLTITIEDKQGVETLVELAGPGRPAETSPEETGEVEATSAGGPPAWLVEQLDESESEPNAAGAADALDGGAARASGNAFMTMPA